MAGININKTTGNRQYKWDNQDITEEMNDRVNALCKSLFTDSEFRKEAVFKDIQEYIHLYDRILYTPISNTIYACYIEHEEEEAESLIGILNSNITAVVNYSQGEEVETFIKNAETEVIRKDLNDTRKAILKIWDHINLAQQQYRALKQSDDEYRKKFNESISPIKEELTKDINSQLLTIVSIFTALAFLIFGGISSLDNIFSNLEFPLFKLMILGSVWGLCILNLIFVFLICVGKMTRLNFKTTNDEDATIFQEYPIVWWSNFVILSIMSLSMWGYYLSRKNIHSWLDGICLSNPRASMILGTGCILLVIFITGRKLLKETVRGNKRQRPS